MLLYHYNKLKALTYGRDIKSILFGADKAVQIRQAVFFDKGT